VSGTYDYDMEPTPAEQHLGDCLAALVDGELEHETRERVLAHLATCHTCKAEADAQRRLKSVFADAAPPPPSEGFLARLQGLPGGLDDDPPEGPIDRPRSAWDFEYLPSRSMLTPDRGFRIHEPDRTSSRGRRFAFAAAGAVSLAAFAIGGALTSATGGPTTATGGEGATAASPLRTAAAGAERGGERSGGRGREEVGTLSGPTTAPTPVPSPTRSTAPPESGYTPRPWQYGPMTVPVLDVSPTVHPPLIRPTQYTAQRLDTGLSGQHAPVGRPFADASPSVTVTVAAPTSTASAPGR